MKTTQTPASVATLAVSDLRAAETAVDDALIRSAELVQNLLQGRLAAGVGARVGQPALVKILSAMQRGAEMRGDLARGHDALEASARLLGLTRADYGGPFEDKGDETREGTRGQISATETA